MLLNNITIHVPIRVAHDEGASGMGRGRVMTRNTSPRRSGRQWGKMRHRGGGGLTLALLHSDVEITPAALVCLANWRFEIKLT